MHKSLPCTSSGLTPRKLQRIYGYVKKATDFYWTQPKYYLHEILSKHWDPFKFLQMATKLLMTYGGIIFGLKTNSHGNTHVIPINGLYTTQHSRFHHLYTHTHTHTHKITYLYILLCMSAQEHVTSTTRGE